MTRLYLCYVLVLLCACCVQPAKKPAHPSFHVEIRQLNGRFVPPDSAGERHSLCFYEDDDYLVNGYCMGEFGGGVIFQRKQTGEYYMCPSTCPVSLHKIDSQYILTSSLAHLEGFTTVIAIPHPDSLDTYIPEYENGHEKISPLPPKAAKGVIQLADSLGIMTLTAFPVNDRLYYITCDWENTYVSTIENGKFVHVQKIYDKMLFARSDDAHFVDRKGYHIAYWGHPYAESNSEVGYVSARDSNIILNVIR